MSFFSKNLKYLRNEKHLSQNKLAELTGVNQTTIARWETEEISPSLDNIYDLASALNVPISDLTGKDMSLNENNCYDELDVLFNKSKAILSDSDKAIIKTIIEERKKAIDKELDG